ncbi:30S ribosomal protein S21 [Nitrobacter sp. Nb-311A]|nr:30S ribosomal protein S21 [Nitrobacter sp. Nb-311A]
MESGSHQENAITGILLTAAATLSGRPISWPKHIVGVQAELASHVALRSNGRDACRMFQENWQPVDRRFGSKDIPPLIRSDQIHLFRYRTRNDQRGEIHADRDVDKDSQG